jgi:hypothetical protein
VRANEGAAIAPAERLMLDMRSEAVFRYWENVYYQHRGLVRRERIQQVHGNDA